VNKKILQKRTLYFVGYIVFLIVIITTMILLQIFLKNTNVANTINGFLLFFLLIVSIIFREVFNSINNRAKTAKLLLLSGKPLSYEKSIYDSDYNFKKYIENQGFKKYADREEYQIYYRIRRMSEIIVKKVDQIYIVVKINNSSFDFYGEIISKQLELLQDDLKKESKLKKFVIIMFKQYKSMDKEILQELSEIVSYNKNGYYFTQINAAYIIDQKLISFLYSEKYSPNNYYTQGVNCIKSIINHKNI
jgi:hypothetical protein